MNKPYIIAEAATNHDGNIDAAKKLIDAAVEAGADAIKFQIINPEGLYVERIIDGESIEENPAIETRRKSMLNNNDYLVLADYAKKNKIDFTASVFDKKGLDLMKEIKPPFIKIASCDLNNQPFLEEVVDLEIPIIISTGMANLAEIEETVIKLEKLSFNDYNLMHCVSVYPSKLEDMKLGFIKLLNQIKENTGFSDHTKGYEAAIMSVALGTRIFEKHFTLDSSKEGYDHKHSVEPNELKEYINKIKNACKALDYSLENKLSTDEKNIKVRARRGIYFSKNLPKDHVIKKEDLKIVRPENDFSPKQIDEIIGKVIKESVIKDNAVKKTILKEG